MTTILFQGDSITDAGRNRQQADVPNELWALASGYAGKTAGKLLSAYPDKELQIFNRGISGHRITDLYARWRKDAINVKPDILSILIGINDLWHGFKRDDGVEAPRFDQVYRMLLDYTREQLGDIQLVLCTPFITPAGDIDDRWPPALAERQAIVKAIAKDYNAIVVDFGRLFEQLLDEAPAAYWAPDGVHPSPAGHERMSETWLAATQELFV